MSTELFGSDAYSPGEVARRVETVGVAKAEMALLPLAMLGVLAGAFIGLGSMLFVLVRADAGLGFAASQLVGGLVFSLGLLLVVVAGAELFTGNMLVVIAWLAGRVTTGAVLRAWAIAYAGNFAGALATAGLVYASGQWTMAGARVGAGALLLADGKLALTLVEALVRGILGNALVCLAVWLCYSARSNVDKILGVVGPVTAFVAAGFEHSIANMYFVPRGLFLRDEPSVLAAAGLGVEAAARLTWARFVIGNLLPVTAGNIIGGGVLVAAAYWTIYLRPAHRA